MGFLDCNIARIVALCLIGIGVPVFLILLFLPAWYGRYTSNIHYYFGSLPAKVAWILQECPSFLIPFICMLCNLNLVQSHWVNIICLCFYLFHYLYRYFLFFYSILDLLFIHSVFVMENAFLLKSG